VVIITVFDVIEVKNKENNALRYLRVLHLIAYHKQLR